MGTVLMTESASAPESCCYSMSERGGVAWTFAVPDQEQCTSQLVVKGVSWDGSGVAKLNVSSQADCCSQAYSMHKEAWSYDEKHKECVVFSSVRGRISDSGSVSGMGEAPQTGKCTIFSKVTGNKTTSGATSAKLATPTASLFPSWPASSPWVTAVGSTRFINQSVDQPEMATDQFGSGGGFSTMFDAFDSQKAAVKHYLKNAKQLPPKGMFPPGGRATPDVSGLGEGYQVYIHGHPEPVGGTSASAPMFAGLVSLLNEARLAKGMPAMGYINPWLYKNHDAFTDVTIGDNYRGRSPYKEPYGFNTSAGWDPVTGLGTPRFDKMLSAAIAGPVEIVV